MNLQICFVDDDIENGSVDDTNGHKVNGLDGNGQSHDEEGIEKRNGKQNLFSPFNLTSFFTSKSAPNGDNQIKFNNFQSYLDHLHNEAKKSLKAAKEMSQMQSQLEREQKVKLKNQKVNQELINNQTDDQNCGHEPDSGTKLSKDTETVIRNNLRTKSKKRLQIMETDLIKKTTELNSNLVKLLEEREELLIEQDSLLIDIEDLTQYL